MFTIDFTSRVPIYEQICNNVIRLASAGVFKSAACTNGCKRNRSKPEYRCKGIPHA